MNALAGSMRWIAGALLAAAACAQPTLNVPAQFATIQAAIVAATNGATVLVAPGTYNGSVNFLGKAITVISSQGAAVTSIVGTSAGRVVSFVTNETAASVLDGFTVRGGNGGIVIQNASPLVRRCVIVNNVQFPTWESGGGIRVFANASSNASPTIAECSIESNWTSGAGGGIWIDVNAGSSAMPLITDCRIEGNFSTGPFSAGSGGGIAIVGPVTASATIRRCRIADNSAVGSTAAAGGIYAAGGANVTVTDCTILRNHSNTNAGAFGTSGNNSVISNCLIAGNSAPLGGVATVDGNLRISNCTIVGNVCLASAPPVGGIVQNCNAATAITIENSILWGNVGIDFFRQPGCGLGTTSITYSMVGVAFAPLGAGAVFGDPRFVDPDNGDYHLAASSLCRNAGDPLATNLPAVDIDGTPRLVGAAVDIGCDEFPATPFPGTGEDLDLFSWIDGAGDPQASALNPLAGQTVRVRLRSAGGTFAGAGPLLVAQAFPLGMPPAPVPGLPGIHFDPFAGFTVLLGSLTPPAFPAPGLPSPGLTFEALVPPGLLGTVIRVQGFALTPLATNALYAATPAHDVVLP